ncbi:DNA helicase/exodeoxyribonuclease V, alpha subunit [Franzmannia pantelleriensis]|uniref:RecBCD enzyme subunit RecD n=1 Tax=Franzmannia pantelleriensis TaxID=48727 RepID=A0A1G9ID32_9GAMM|nr:exodeoxyribonuclease V subunit alpha [Halomonas pantelleriensis]SDL23140.1 DNA helicase/exodeoxyribonuclease V, alpha subunit [Halomonas pantelleriensis]
MSKGSKDTHNDPTPDLFGGLLDDAPRPEEVVQASAQDEDASAELHDVAALTALLDRWVERGWLRALDRALAVFLHREVDDAPPLLLLAAALASHQLGRGHVCLDLAQTLAAPDLALSLPPEGDDLSDPPPLPSEVLAELQLATWRTALDHPLLIADGNGQGNTPLVRTEHSGNTRLYLRRYWQYEQDIRGLIGARLPNVSINQCRSDFSRDDAPTNQCGSDFSRDDAPTNQRGSDFSRDDAPTNQCGSDFSRDDGPTNQCGSDFSRDGAARRPDTTTLATALSALFTTTELDWQKTACALAAQAHFTVITGGPGTGKTTTVVKLLALLQALALGEPTANQAPRPLRIRLAAPTGKAAARLNESIAKQVQNLSLVELAVAVGQQGVDISTLRDSIPTEVTTLHRLLGSRPDTRHFRHHAGNPLALDALVIDEASMVDIEMMAAVLTALPPKARLILLGDKDQLASVEAGAVLGDLCQRAEGGHYTPATTEWLEAVTGTSIPAQYQDADGQPLDQAIAMLRVSHRFDAQSGIGQLAEAVNRPLAPEHGQKEKRRAVSQVFQQEYADLARLRLADADDPALDRLVVNGNPAGFINGGEGRHDRRGEPIAPPRGYAHYLNVMQQLRPAQPYFGEGEARQPYDDWARQLLAAHGHFQLLCALRKGPWGIEGLNPRIGRALRRAGWLKASDLELEQGWFEGRPVLVTRNDYGLGLMNGDIGITLAVPEARSATDTPARTLLRVAFPASDGSGDIKWVLPSRLQAVETVFAMTVHKSQGSEFTHTALLLPDAPNPILTRELVYTGITRARDWLTLVETGRGMLDEAVTTKVVRVSGLGML